MSIDTGQLQRASMGLSDVVADSSRWMELLEEVALATGAMGAALIPHGGSQGAVATTHLRECLDVYVRECWQEHDAASHQRARRLNMQGQVALDRDLNLAGAQQAPFFREFLPRFDGRWWAGIGISSGPDFWSLTLHRARCQGEFDDVERAVLKQFSLRLNEVCTLAHLVGRAGLQAVTESFDPWGKAAVAIDDAGRLIHANGSARRLFGPDIQVAAGRLTIRDRYAAAEYERLIGRLRILADGKTLNAAPIVVRRETGVPLVLRMLPVDGAARSPFLAVRALVMIDELARPAVTDWTLLRRAFGLTPAEARLAALLATGDTLEHAAQALGITRGTARTSLKAIFQKTGVHRQAALVALVARL